MLSENKTLASISFFRKASALIVVVLLALSQFAGGAKSRSSKRQSDAAKADYIFLEALRYEADDSIDAYYDMLCRAYQLNPDDPYLGFDYGFHEYLINRINLDDDAASQKAMRHGLDLMRRYVVANPKDYMNGFRLASAYGAEEMQQESIDIFRRLYEASADPRLTGSAYATGLAYTFNNDSIRKAITILDDVEKYTGMDENTIAQRAKYYGILGDSMAIIREIQRYVNTDPRSVDRLVLMADVYAKYGSADSAMVYYDRAVAADPSSGVALFARAQGYMTVGDTAASVREIIQAMHYPDLDADTKLQILQTYMSADEDGNVAMSDSIIADLLIDLTTQYPYNERVRTLYGSYLYSKDDKVGSAEQFSFALEQNPDSPDLWSTLASIYYMLDDYDKASETMNRAIEYFPENTQMYLQKSSIDAKRKQFDQAYGLIDKAIALADTTNHAALAELNGAMGDIAYQAGDQDKAWKYYSIALELDPYNSTLLNNVAYYMACLNKDLDKAQDYVEEALRIERMMTDANSATTLDTYAWVLFKRKDYAKAYEVINQTLELDSDVSADVLEHAGDIYFMNGHPDEALEFWTKAFELSPDNELLQRKVENKTFFFE